MTKDRTDRIDDDLLVTAPLGTHDKRGHRQTATPLSQHHPPSHSGLMRIHRVTTMRVTTDR